LLGRDIPDAPALDPQSSQTRLLILIADLFRRQSQPMVVILEDLHWASSENLIILERLAPLVAEIPLMLIGSYRDDERPELRDRLPQLRFLRLKRLTQAGIAALSESILGAAGHQPHVLDFLQRETEGNAFFLVEVVRALAERAGELSKIGSTTLTEGIVARGMRDIIQRRLNRAPDSTRPLLRLAAVAGRELDLEVLRTAEQADLDSWLTLCVNAAILEAHEDSWRFSHDKLREGVVAEIPAHELPLFHQRIAEAIESVYAESPELIPALAHHYRQAGVRDKAIHYLALAAEQARAKFANQEAVNLYQLALGQIHTAEDPIAVQLYEGMGHVLSLMGHHDDALSAFQAAMERISSDDRIRKSRLFRQMAKIGIAQHLHQNAVNIYDQAELVLGAQSSEAGWWEEWLNVNLDRFTLYYWMYAIDAMEAVSVKIRPILEQYGTPVQRSHFAAYMGTLVLRRQRFAGVLDEAVAFGYEGLAAAEESGDISQISWVHFLLGFITLWNRQLDIAQIELETALELARRTGDVMIQSRALTYLTIVCRKRGQIDGVRHYAPLALEVASLAHMPEYIAMAQANLAWASQREGDIVTAEALASVAVVGMRITPQGKMTPWVANWPLMRVRLLQGNIAESIELARELLNPVIQPQPDDMAAELEAAIRAWDSDDTDAAAQHFEQACSLARVEGYL
ncbi:MAG: hypothetical protein OIN84_01355, partial [Candidatus Methanoperedens sp.]|nr:hypothetical protein [Candidatus Methanoperedens sp.]